MNAGCGNSKSKSIPQLKGARGFSFGELKKYTNDFSTENEIGSGGYGKVILNHHVLVYDYLALKRMILGFHHGLDFSISHHIMFLTLFFEDFICNCRFSTFRNSLTKSC